VFHCRKCGARCFSSSDEDDESEDSSETELIRTLARKVHKELAGPRGKGQKGEKTAKKVRVLRSHKMYSKIWENFGKITKSKKIFFGNSQFARLLLFLLAWFC
jgi:hypothetical protein